MFLPTPFQIAALHDAILVQTGGQPGLRDPGALDGAIGAIAQGQAYGGWPVDEAAARLGGRIAKAHAFVDGNKRASVAAWALALALNGWHTTATPEARARAAIRAATDGHPPFLTLPCAPDPVFGLLMAYDRQEWR